MGGCASTISLSDLVDALDTFNNAFVGESPTPAPCIFRLWRMLRI